MIYDIIAYIIVALIVIYSLANFIVYALRQYIYYVRSNGLDKPHADKDNEIPEGW